MFVEKHVQYFMGKRCFGLAKTQREGAKTQREGADKLEALGHELEEGGRDQDKDSTG
jgi:hypothetical protein